MSAPRAALERFYDVIRGRNLAALDRSEQREVEAALPPLGDDFEYLGARGMGVGRPGGAQLLAETYTGDITGAFRVFAIDADEIVEAGERFVVLATVRLGMHGSEAELTQGAGAVWTFSEGRAVRLEDFTDRDAALRAAGVDERSVGS